MLCIWHFVSGCWLCPLRSISANASACFSLHLRSARSGSGRWRTKGDVNGAAHGAHCTFEITLLQAIMLTLLFVCAFSPRVHSIPRGPLFLKLTTKRHKVSAKINTLHNARKRKRFPNANLRLGSLLRKSQTKNAQPNRLCVFVGGR